MKYLNSKGRQKRKKKWKGRCERRQRKTKYMNGKGKKRKRERTNGKEDERKDRGREKI